MPDHTDAATERAPPPRGPLRGRLERQWLSEGLRFAGVDEVGRGCLAGPVHAGFAQLNWQKFKRLASTKRGLIRDSKQLSERQRAAIVPTIIDVCQHWAIASASSQEIDQLGIVKATFLAMHRAIAAAAAAFDLLIIDGKWPLTDYSGRQAAVIKGDHLCYSVAAASILAKQARDTFMAEQANLYPTYGFAEHVGYGTKLHLAKIRAHGICPLHRKSFAPIRSHTAEHPSAAL